MPKFSELPPSKEAPNDKQEEALKLGMVRKEGGAMKGYPEKKLKREVGEIFDEGNHVDSGYRKPHRGQAGDKANGPYGKTVSVKESKTPENSYK